MDGFFFLQIAGFPTRKKEKFEETERQIVEAIPVVPKARRKGKERKGKERKGKERKGKERKKKNKFEIG